MTVCDLTDRHCKPCEGGVDPLNYEQAGELLTSLHAQALTSLVAQKRGEWDNSAIISFYNDLSNM